MSATPPPPPPPPPSVPPPGPPGPGYGAPQPGAVPENNKMALWSMILGIVGLLCCGILAPVALVLGIMARNQIEASGGREGGSGMAMAGIVLGAIGIVLWIIGLILNFSGAYTINVG